MATKELLDQVVAAAANTYRWADHSPIATDREGTLPDNSIYLPKLRRLETALSDLEAVSENDLQNLETFRSKGIEVWVLVPLANLGKAHNRLRQYADRIQSYWIDETSLRVKFGTAETP